MKRVAKALTPSHPSSLSHKGSGVAAVAGFEVTKENINQLITNKNRHSAGFRIYAVAS
jgi:hypothetical protein